MNGKIIVDIFIFELRLKFNLNQGPVAPNFTHAIPAQRRNFLMNLREGSKAAGSDTHREPHCLRHRDRRTAGRTDRRAVP